MNGIIKIDELLQLLQEAKEKGGNYVSISDDCKTLNILS